MLQKILFAILLTFTLATGCASAAKKPLGSRGAKGAAASQTVQDARDLEQRGKYLDAGLAYAHLANRATGPAKQDLQLEAAEVLLHGNYTTQANQILAEIDAENLNNERTERRKLLLAQVDLARGQLDRALVALNALENTATIDQTRLALHGFKIQIYTQKGSMFDAARERAKLNGLLTDETARRNNETALMQNLLDTPEAVLMRAKPTESTNFAGWIELVLILKSAQQQPAELSRLLNDWEQKFPHHGGASFIDQRIARRDARPVELPKRVALLLPQQGSFEKAAEAVRDGFLAAYYAQNGDNAFRPELRIYDSGANPADVMTVYQRAVREGAQFVVGPLDKNAVNVLAQYGQLPVPTLGLNYAEHADAETGLFQFGLSPEDEAAQTAERAWLDGHNRAVALVPEGSFGERLLNAFKERWLQLGGELVDVQTYSVKDNDFSAPIKKLLDIDLSEQRRVALRATMGYDIKFSPRRRNDVDMVFVGATPKHARLIRPQLDFYQATNLPVYATSHVFSGIANARLDHDVNNVTFGDMPWVLPKSRRNTALSNSIVQLWPQQVENYIRLYAFGIDAFNLIPNLNQLAQSRTTQLPGETGNLYMDDQHRVQRRLYWAEFKNGTPRLLE